MSKTAALTSGVLGGAATMLTRTATRKAMYAKNGAPRLPQRATQRQGMVTMLLWAAAAGVLLALADVLLKQRRQSAESPPEFTY